ncbi:hypothetical protein KCU93_g8344, partial [Aureobasidium melanogenum]
MSSIKPATSTSEPKSIPDSATVTPAHCQTCKPAPISSLNILKNTLKNILWYMAVGVASGALLNYLGVIEYTSNNDGPRSICLSHNQHDLYTTWVAYGASKVKNGESIDVANYSSQCFDTGRKTELKTTLNDGGILFSCVI